MTTVWISLAARNSSLALSMNAEPIAGDAPYPQGYHARNDAGEPLGPECFPKAMWTEADRERASIPEFARGINGFVLSARCADIFRRFALGGGALYPVQLLRRDRVTPIAGEYFLLNIGNQKQALLPDQSAFLIALRAGRWRPMGMPKDDEIALSAAALGGADIWVDTSLRDAFFMSKGLGDALKEARLARNLMMSKCRVVR